MARGNDGVRIEGLTETVRNLERLGVDVEDLREAFGQISRRIVSEATDGVARLTGTLAGTIRPARTKNKAQVRAGTAGAPYAGVINYGWPARGITGSEFLTRPANDRPEEHARDIEANLQALLRQHHLT